MGPKPLSEHLAYWCGHKWPHAPSWASGHMGRWAWGCRGHVVCWGRHEQLGSDDSSEPFRQKMGTPGAQGALPPTGLWAQRCGGLSPESRSELSCRNETLRVQPWPSRLRLVEALSAGLWRQVHQPGEGAQASSASPRAPLAAASGSPVTERITGVRFLLSLP